MIVQSDLLRSFAAFAEDANLSRAARRLHLSQPAVHAQLKRLAEDLGVPLYHRVGRNLALTKEGVEVAAFAREMDERSEELLARLRGGGAERRVVLAAGAGVLVHVLGDGIRAFTHGRSVRVEVTTVDAARAVDAVRRGAAHVGAAALDAEPEDLHVQRLVTTPQLLVAPRSHRIAKKRSASLADLDGQRLVAPPEGGPQRIALDAAFAARGARMDVAATARGWDVVLRLVELGVGLGIVNGTCKIPRTLVARPLRELPHVRYVVFTRPRPREDTKALVETLIQHARAT